MLDDRTQAFVDAFKEVGLGSHADLETHLLVTASKKGENLNDILVIHPTGIRLKYYEIPAAECVKPFSIAKTIAQDLKRVLSKP